MVFGAEAATLLHPPKKAREELFRRFDGNGNGRLSYGEVEEAVAGLWPCVPLFLCLLLQTCPPHTGAVF